MLSVKHIMPNGRETVRLVEKVEFDPVSSRTAKSSDDCDYIFIWVGRDFPERIEVGTVYVMNENGKTVATYKLGDGEAKTWGERPYVNMPADAREAFSRTLQEWHHQPLEVTTLEDASGCPIGNLAVKPNGYRPADPLPGARAGGRNIKWGIDSGEATQESGCISAPANTAGIR